MVVLYKARIERVEHYTLGGKYVFRFTSQRKDNPTATEWEELPRNVHAIRDEFLRISVKEPDRVSDFLMNTGVFSPLSDTITSGEFERWQQFAKLVQVHTQLSVALNDAMNDPTNPAKWTGECAEVLKALYGYYPNSFFDGCEIPQTFAETEFVARYLREHAEIVPKFEQGRHRQERRRRELWRWFRQPPSAIEWIPGSLEAEQKVFKTRIDQKSGLPVLDVEASPCVRGGVMIEYLLPKQELTPVIVIRPTYTLQAIAAAIYVDRIKGVEYRECDWHKCGAVFKIGDQPNKIYCSERCGDIAHSKRTRGRVKDARDLLLKGWKNGLSESEIERSLTVLGLSPKARKSAREKALKEHQRNTKRLRC